MKLNDNALMTLDGLINRLIDIREIAGSDCPIVIGKSFNPRKDRMKLTMVSLDSSFKHGTKHRVSMLVEDMPVVPRFVCKETIDHFERAFSAFEKDNPDWKSELTDSTYYELAEWYDEFIGVANNEHLSDVSYKFADYVWKKLEPEHE